MNFFGGRRGSHGGSTHAHSNTAAVPRAGGHSHCSGHQCNHGPAAGPAHPYAPSAGGALGQGAQTTVVQPGMEMMPSALHGMGGGGGALGGLLGVSDLEGSLAGAPPDVLAAAERLSLVASSGGEGGVVRTAPGAESTDTGELSVSDAVHVGCACVIPGVRFGEVCFMYG